MDEKHIPNGCILLSRNIEESAITKWPTWQRWLWVVMLLRATHSDGGPGKKLKRGQLHTTTDSLIEAATYFAGDRPIRPDRKAISAFLRRCREAEMITTAKTTRGVIITICQYDRYQTLANYETDSENTTKPTRSRREHRYDRQEGKNDKNDKNNTSSAAQTQRVSRRRNGFDPSKVTFPASLDNPEFQKAWADWSEHRRQMKKPLTKMACDRQLIKCEGLGKDAAIAMIEQSIMNGWQGLFETKGAKDKGEFEEDGRAIYFGQQLAAEREARKRAQAQ